MCTPQAVLWHAGPLAAVLFGQAPEVSLLVSRYCRWLTPGLLPMVSWRAVAVSVHVGAAAAAS